MLHLGSMLCNSTVARDAQQSGLTPDQRHVIPGSRDFVLSRFSPKHTKSERAASPSVKPGEVTLSQSAFTLRVPNTGRNIVVEHDPAFGILSNMTPAARIYLLVCLLVRIIEPADLARMGDHQKPVAPPVAHRGYRPCGDPRAWVGKRITRNAKQRDCNWGPNTVKRRIRRRVVYRHNRAFRLVCGSHRHRLIRWNHSAAGKPQRNHSHDRHEARSFFFHRGKNPSSVDRNSRQLAVRRTLI